MDAEKLIATRWSLLSRLKDWGDRDSWQEFFDTYWRLIYDVASKSGLRDAEAQDVVQEVLLAVARKMPENQARPGARFVQRLVAECDALAHRRPVSQTASRQPGRG